MKGVVSKLEAWKKDPARYFREVLGVEKMWRLQEELLAACPRAIAEHRAIYVASGHCFAMGTKILMHDGEEKNVEDIVVGDRVMGDDSMARVVHGLSRGREKMYEINFYDGTRYVCNESHILCLKAMSNHGRMVKGAEHEITVRDFLKLGSKWRRRLVGYHVGVEYEKKCLPIPPYIFGVWLGDGCKSSADFCGVDKEVIDEVEEYCKFLNCEMRHKDNGKNHHMVWGSFKAKDPHPFLDKLRKLGVFKNKHIPHDYLCSSREQRLELLAGLIDTDGHSSFNGGYDIIQKKKILAEQIVTLARSLGVRSRVYPKFVKTEFKSGHKKEGIYWRVYIGLGLDDLPVRLKRKRPTLQKRGNKKERDLQRTAIKDVKFLGVGDYYGFSIDGNQKFLGADFMVLHNSLGKDWCCGGIGLWFLQTYRPSVVIETAPTFRQVQEIQWKETNVHWNNRKIDLGGRKYTDPYIEIRKDWYLTGFTTKETGKTKEGGGGKFQGYHSNNICVIVTEAQGLEDEIYDQIDGVATSENVLLIFIGNPTRASGRFAEGLKNKQKNIVFHFSCLENPNYLERKTVVPGLASYEWVEDKRLKWGESDPRWVGRVLGQIPDVSINNTFPEWLINHAKSRYGLLIGGGTNAGVAVDPSGEGVDDNVIMSGKNGDVIKTYTKTLMSPSDIAHKAVAMCKEVDGNFIVVDCDGIGIGTYQELNKLDDKYLEGIKIIKFHGSSPSEFRVKDKEVYQNMRSEASFTAQEQAKNGKASLPPDDRELIEDLKSEEYFENKRGLLQIEAKDDLKERLKRSPGRGDAWKMLQWGMSKNYKRRKSLINRIFGVGQERAVTEYDVLNY